MTNYEHIKQMSIFEMARKLSDNIRCRDCFAEEFCNQLNNSDSDDLVMMRCEQRFKLWLEQEVES